MKQGHITLAKSEEDGVSMHSESKPAARKAARGVLPWVILLLVGVVSFTGWAYLRRLSLSVKSGEATALAMTRCHTNMSVVLVALQHYANDHRDSWPARLQELCPAYIVDVATLTCPMAKLEGGEASFKYDPVRKVVSSTPFGRAGAVGLWIYVGQIDDAAPYIKLSKYTRE